MIRSKPDQRVAQHSHKEAIHEWIAVATLDPAFRARCPRCGVTREYDTRGDATWVSYTNRGEFLAHGRLGDTDEPSCEQDESGWPAEWDVLSLS